MGAITATTAMYIAAAAAVASAGVSAYSAREQGKTAAAVAEYNAKVTENNALREEMESRESARRQRIENRRALGRQRTAVAHAGVVEAGTPLEVMADTAAKLELSVLDQRYGSQARGESLTTMAAIERYSGGRAKMAGNIGAGASLLQGISSAAGTYSRIPSGG